MVESFVSGGTVEEKKDIDFPALMIARTGMVILAKGYKDSYKNNIEGVVIKNDSLPLSTWDIGDYSNTWVISAFTLCKSSITLKNKTE